MTTASGADKLVRVPVIGAPAAQRREEPAVSQYSSMSTLSLPVRLAFGIGQLAEAVKNQGFNVFLLFFCNQVLGVSASLTGLALLWRWWLTRSVTC